MFRATTFVAVVMLATAASTAGAQDAVLAEMYGRGVHRYFANEFDQAYEDLTLAIDNGLQDPRAYYFRGLAAAALGRQDEAEADWRTGATYEARGNYTGSIGRALARIQGTQRLQLEDIRQLVRLEERARSEARSRARYEALDESEPRSLRSPGRAPAPPAAPAPAAPADPAPATPTDPAPAVPPAPADASSNPFEDDGGLFEGEATLEADDALGDPLAPPAPADDAPADTVETPPADDGLFSGDEPAAGDPFGVDDDGEPESEVDDPFDF